eukprot:scaffold51977_cov52-Phaeocystis_antarctica.AAC.3
MCPDSRLARSTSDPRRWRNVLGVPHRCPGDIPSRVTIYTLVLRRAPHRRRGRGAASGVRAL